MRLLNNGHTFVVPCVFCAVVRISLTNHTLNLTCGVIRILFWAVAFKFEAMTLSTVFVVAVICSGLFLASWGQTDFSLEGMIMILGASCLSGLRRVKTGT